MPRNERCEEPSDRVTKSRPRRGRFLRWAAISAVLYLALAAMFFSLQIDLIFPGSKLQGDPSTVVKPRPDEQLLTLKTLRGERVVALFGPALNADGSPHPSASSCPTLLYFYGNGMSLSAAVDQVEHFRRLGANVLVPDYVGYGMSGGKPSESGCQETADAALEHLRTRKDIDPKRIVAAGRSLGGAVALDLASREKLAGLVVLSTFTSMTEMSRHKVPFLPASILLRHKFDNLSKIAHVACPILIGHGRRDALIPHEMAERLARSAHVPVMKFTVEEAGHNDFYAVGGDQVLDAIRTFVTPLPPSE